MSAAAIGRECIEAKIRSDAQCRDANYHGSHPRRFTLCPRSVDRARAQRDRGWSYTCRCCWGLARRSGLGLCRDGDEIGDLYLSKVGIWTDDDLTGPFDEPRGIYHDSLAPGVDDRGFVPDGRRQRRAVACDRQPLVSSFGGENDSESRELFFDRCEVLRGEIDSVLSVIAPREGEGSVVFSPRGGGSPLKLVTERDVQECSASWVEALALFELGARPIDLPCEHQRPPILKELGAQRFFFGGWLGKTRPAVCDQRKRRQHHHHPRRMFAWRPHRIHPSHFIKSPALRQAIRAHLSAACLVETSRTNNVRGGHDVSLLVYNGGVMFGGMYDSTIEEQCFRQEILASIAVRPAHIPEIPPPRVPEGWTSDQEGAVLLLKGPGGATVAIADGYRDGLRVRTVLVRGGGSVPSCAELDVALSHCFGPVPVETHLYAVDAVTMVGLTYSPDKTPENAVHSDDVSRMVQGNFDQFRENKNDPRRGALAIATPAGWEGRITPSGLKGFYRDHLNVMVSEEVFEGEWVRLVSVSRTNDGEKPTRADIIMAAKAFLADSVCEGPLVVDEIERMTARGRLTYLSRSKRAAN